MISIMVQNLSINYVIANLLSIVFATVIRYLVADKLLWSTKKLGQAKTIYSDAVTLPGAGEVQKLVD